MKRRIVYIGALLAALAALAVALFTYEERPANRTYYRNEGKVFGTYYNVRYDAERDLSEAIDSAFAAFDRSLSMFNPESVISAVNQNRDTMTDERFEQMWAQAMQVS